MQENNNRQEPQIQPGDVMPNAGATPEIKEELSKVASSPKKNILVLAMVTIGFAVMAYNILAPIFFAKPDSRVEETLPTPQNVAVPSKTEADIPPIPQVPEPPKLVAPTPPMPQEVEEKTETPPPPPLPTAPSPSPIVMPASSETSKAPAVSALSSQEAEAAKQRAESKRKSSIILVGGVPPKEISEIEKEQQNDFKKRGNLEYVLGQGKIIEAVTESAINSDYENEIRAVIVRDVYSENGKVILIPKGTRVFGTFSTADASVGRVNIVWNKINLESGYTLTLASNAVDNLGRGGIQGRVDNKYVEQMTNAVLTSAFNIGVASGLERIVPPVTSISSVAQSTASITSFINAATNIFGDNTTYASPPAPAPADPDATALTKINAICAQLPIMVTDKTSSVYTQISQSCLNAQTAQANLTKQQQLTNLMTQISSSASTAAQSVAANSTPSQTQEAAKQAYTDISNKAKEMIGQNSFKPTVTINQGTKIKIYVNKDYIFPKDAINKTKVIN